MEPQGNARQQPRLLARSRRRHAVHRRREPLLGADHGRRHGLGRAPQSAAIAVRGSGPEPADKIPPQPDPGIAEPLRPRLGHAVGRLVRVDV